MIPFTLSTRKRSVGLIIAAGALALAALLAVTMGSPVPAPIPGIDGGFRWNPTARDASALQAAAVGQLLDWLKVAGWAAFTVGAISVLALFGHVASAAGNELVVHRAVGASRRTLVRRAIGGGILLGLVAIASGTGLGLGGAAGATGAWPGPPVVWHWAGTLPLFLLMFTAVVGALFMLTGLGTRRLAEPPPAVPPLTIPAVQLGLALAVTVAGAMVIRRVDRVVATGPESAIARGWLVTATAPETTLEQRAARYDSLLRSFEANGATLASLTNAGGHLGLGTVDRLVTDCGQCYVGGIFLRWRDLDAGYHTVSADTFQARGIKVVEGRGITTADQIGSQPVAVVNLHLAQRYFESGQPVGRDVFLGGRLGSTPYRVVGVVDDGKPEGLGGGQGPLERVYLSSLQHPSSHMEIWTSGATRPRSGAGAAVSYRAYIAAQRAPLRWFGRWFEIEGTLALLLGAIGTGALLWLWVRALRPELGLRRAVGATRGRVLLEILGPAAKAGLGGAAAGVVFFGPTLWPEVSRIATGMEWWQPALILPIGAVLVAAAIAGALVPGIAASRASCVELWTDQ